MELIVSIYKLKNENFLVTMFIDTSVTVVQLLGCSNKFIQCMLHV